MINRLRTPLDNQWRTSQQISGKPPKSPRKQQEQSYTNPFYCSQENQNYNRNPQQNNMKGKPLISPKRSQNLDPTNFSNNPTQRGKMLSERNNIQKMCLNHPNKRAEYTISEGGPEQIYCGRCAAQLATRGCEVIHLNTVPTLKLSKRNELPHYPQYEDEPIYQQILDILQQSSKILSAHDVNIQRWAKLEEEYQQQIHITGAFYDRLVEIIQQMKADHLYDLAQQRDKYTQIADIQNDHLRQNIIQINNIKNDIQNNLQQVMEGIRESGNEGQCRQSLDHYRQKLALFNHQLEEQLETLKQVTRYSQEKIDFMLQDFQNFLKVLWDDPDQTVSRSEQPVRPSGKNLNSALTVKNIHQILPRGVQQGKRAFRNLQEDQEESHFQERKSPNFKRI